MEESINTITSWKDKCQYVHRNKKHAMPCWVSPVENLIYFQIPKNASRVFRKFFKCGFNISGVAEEELFPKVEGRSYKMYYQDFKDKENQYVKFAILRNPFDRLISSYLELTNSKKKVTGKKKVEFLKIKEEIPRFKMFLDELEEQFFDLHVAPQIYFVSDKNYESITDIEFLILERNELWNEILGIEERFPIMHSTLVEEKNGVIETIEKESLRERINNIYKDDWALYERVCKKIMRSIKKESE
jgi:hypothetical protein